MSATEKKVWAGDTLVEEAVDYVCRCEEFHEADPCIRERLKLTVPCPYCEQTGRASVFHGLRVDVLMRKDWMIEVGFAGETRPFEEWKQQWPSPFQPDNMTFTDESGQKWRVWW